MKTCNKCKLSKPLEAFSNHPNGIQGKHPKCSECRNEMARAYYLIHRERLLAKQKGRDYHKDTLKKFNLTPEQYAEMLAYQNGLCAICNNPPEKQRLAVDHDHETGQIRGLLCRGCNLGIGYLKDNILTLESAILYLNKTR